MPLSIAWKSCLETGLAEKAHFIGPQRMDERAPKNPQKQKKFPFSHLDPLKSEKSP